MVFALVCGAMKVIVDYDLCQSNAVCVSVMPDVFEVRDDGFLYLLREEVGDDEREKLESAVRSCPTGAISIGEDDKEPAPPTAS